MCLHNISRHRCKFSNGVEPSGVDPSFRNAGTLTEKAMPSGGSCDSDLELGPPESCDLCVCAHEVASGLASCKT